jgi:hypothetical protein
MKNGLTLGFKNESGSTVWLRRMHGTVVDIISALLHTNC